MDRHSGGPPSARKIDPRKIVERLLAELGPAVVFFAALLVTGLTAATVVFAVATAASAAFSWVRQRRFPVIPAAMTAAALGFGGLTVLFHDPMWIQIRSTLINVAAAAAIVYALMQDKLLLKTALQDGFRMGDATWRVLSWRMAGFLLVLAVFNELIWRSTSTETWAAFKAAMPFLNLLFLAANWPLIRGKIKGEPVPATAAAGAAAGVGVGVSVPNRFPAALPVAAGGLVPSFARVAPAANPRRLRSG
jgi:intracellular septation protein